MPSKYRVSLVEYHWSGGHRPALPCPALPCPVLYPAVLSAIFMLRLFTPVSKFQRAEGMYVHISIDCVQKGYI